MSWFYFSATVWAIATLALFVRSIRLSYKVERLVGPPNRWGLPMKTNVFASAFGSRGKGEPEVDALRRQLRNHLAVIAGLFAIAWVVAGSLDPADGAQ